MQPKSRSKLFSIKAASSESTSSNEATGTNTEGLIPNGKGTYTYDQEMLRTWKGRMHLSWAMSW